MLPEQTVFTNDEFAKLKQIYARMVENGFNKPFVYFIRQCERMQYHSKTIFDAFLDIADLNEQALRGEIN